MVTVATGFSPATKCVPFLGLDTATLTLNSGELRGSTWVVLIQSWDSLTAYLLPEAGWQPAQAASLVCFRLVELWPTPVAKFTSSWQEPQAARLGFFCQAATSLPLPVWHLVQFSITAGKATFHQVWL